MLWEVLKEGVYVLCFSCLGFFCLFVSEDFFVEVFFGSSKSVSLKYSCQVEPRLPGF